MEIEILGHKARIDSIDVGEADSVWSKEDCLIIGLVFNMAEADIRDFSVYLPVDDYTKEEFLSRIKAEAETTLPDVLKKRSEEAQKQKDRRERRIILNAIVDRLKSEIAFGDN